MLRRSSLGQMRFWAIWTVPHPRPLHARLAMRLRYCPSCRTTKPIIGTGRCYNWTRPKGKKYVGGVLYNGPFKPHCAQCTNNAVRLAKYHADLDHRAKHLALVAARRRRPRGYTGPPLTAEAICEVLAAGICVYCGATTNLSVDHIVPTSAGGGHERSNLQCACMTCNRAKNDLTDQEFRAWVQKAATFQGNQHPTHNMS